MAKKKTIRTIPQARTSMPEQAPELRVTNFDEVASGYRLEDALVESQRCLDCADQP
jgi:glutamate synthase (NADPH/NADH) small chain